MGELVRKGQCKRCGRCCSGKSLMAGTPQLPDDLRAVVDGVECPHLHIVHGLAICGQYDRRPWFCRAHPAEPADLVEGCGFYFEEVDDGQMHPLKTETDG